MNKQNLKIIVSGLMLAYANISWGSGPNPNWCQELGIVVENGQGLGVPQCGIDPRSKTGSDILSVLANTDPHAFLPKELADYLDTCQKTRTEKHPLYPYVCGTLAPFRGAKLMDIMFIPKDRVKKSGLGKSSARVIVDCNGRHLQIRADLPKKQQLEMIKSAFSAILLEATTSRLKEKLSVSSNQAGYQICRITGKKAKTDKVFNVQFENSKTIKYVYWDKLDKIPEEYVPGGCIPDTLLSLERKPVQSQLTSTEQNLQDYFKLSEEYFKSECVTKPEISYCMFKQMIDSGELKPMTGMGGGGMYGGGMGFGMGLGGGFGAPAEPDCTRITVPKKCFDYNKKMAALNPMGKYTTAELRQGYVDLANREASGSEARIKYLQQANMAMGKDQPVGNGYPIIQQNKEVQDKIMDESMIHCRQNPCNCFSGFMPDDGLNTFKLGMTFVVKNPEKQNEFRDLCGQVDLSSCKSNMDIFGSQADWCKSVTEPFAPMGGFYPPPGGDNNTLPPQEGPDNSAGVWGQGLDDSDDDDEACVECNQSKPVKEIFIPLTPL